MELLLKLKEVCRNTVQCIKQPTFRQMAPYNQIGDALKNNYSESSVADHGISVFCK